eukprot:SAG31_NODE_401_length_16206_cov_10.920780_6_plen_634_part_00
MPVHLGRCPAPGNGGAGFYGDGGTTAWTIKSNLIHDTSYFPLERNSKWQGGSGGGPSRIVGNVFVASTGVSNSAPTAPGLVPTGFVGVNDETGKGVIEWEMYTRNETFTDNIVVSLHGGNLVYTGHACNSSWNPGAFRGPNCSDRYIDNFRTSTFDRNLYWVATSPADNATSVPPLFPDSRNSDNGRTPARSGEGMPFAAWQQLGFDKHSVIADPMFREPSNGDYGLLPGSPALKLGSFKPLDLSCVGPNWNLVANLKTDDHAGVGLHDHVVEMETSALSQFVSRVPLLTLALAGLFAAAFYQLSRRLDHLEQCQAGSRKKFRNEDLAPLTSVIVQVSQTNAPGCPIFVASGEARLGSSPTPALAQGPDAAAVINAALAYKYPIEMNGQIGSVRLLPGDYPLATPLVIARGPMTLCGSTGVLLRAANSTKPMGPLVEVMSGASNVVIRDLQLDGAVQGKGSPKAGGGAVGGITISGSVSNVRVENLVVSNVSGSAISAVINSQNAPSGGAQVGITVQSCVIDRCGMGGISLAKRGPAASSSVPDSMVSSGHLVIGNRISRTGSHAVCLTGVSNAQIIANQMSQVSVYNVVGVFGHGIAVDGNCGNDKVDTVIVTAVREHVTHLLLAAVISRSF